MTVYNVSTKYNNSQATTQSSIGLVSLYDVGIFSEEKLLPGVDIRLQTDGNKVFFSGEKNYNFRYNPRTTKVPILPTLKQNIIEIAGKNGGYDFGTEYGERAISIDLWSAKNLSINQIIEQKNFIKDFFVLSNNRRFTSEKDGSNIYYNVKLYKSIDFVDHAGWFQAVIQLVAVDAYGYELNSETRDIPWSTEYTTRTIRLINKQNEDNGFIISLTGALYNPIIKISDPESATTGVQPTIIQLSDEHKQIQSGETILIDMSKMLAIKTTSYSRVNALPMFNIYTDIFTKIKARSERIIEITFSNNGINDGSVGIFYTGYGL